MITNAYILGKSPDRDAIVRDGIHKFLGFPGAVMTDSGAFQSHVYGDVDVTNAEVMAFQKAIHADFGTMLDVFSEPGHDHNRAAKDVDETLRRAQEAVSLRGEMALIREVCPRRSHAFPRRHAPRERCPGERLPLSRMHGTSHGEDRGRGDPPRGAQSARVLRGDPRGPPGDFRGRPVGARRAPGQGPSGAARRRAGVAAAQRIPGRVRAGLPAWSAALRRPGDRAPPDPPPVPTEAGGTVQPAPP